MAIYSAASAPAWTPTAVANTTAMSANGYHALRGGSATQRVNVLEIYEGGQAPSSAPMAMLVGRNVSVSTTPTALTMALLDANAAASATVPVNFQTASTQPQRSNTLGYLLNLSFNAFGGIVRWYKGPEETLSLYGTATDAGEISLSAFSPGSTVGVMGSHFIIEAV